MVHDPGKLAFPPAIKILVEDAPALQEHQVNKVGVLVGAATRGVDDDFPGVDLFESSDDGVTFFGRESIHGEAVIGRVSGTPLPGGVSPHFWDLKNTFTVVLDNELDELSSEPEEDVASGKVNILLVGREIVGFATATLVSSFPKTYTISTLLRGRRGTEQWIADHADNESVMLLTPPSAVRFVETGFVPLYQDLVYRGIPSGLPITEVEEEVQLTLNGESMRQLPPIMRPQIKKSNDDILIGWVRRSKSIFRSLGGVLAPNHDCSCSARFEIEIWSADRTTLKRTISVTDVEEYNYTAADQTTDFGSPQSSVKVTVYHMGPVVGRGRPALSEDATMANDPLLGTPLLVEGTAKAETLVNEYMARHQAATTRIVSRFDTTPPGSPANFDAYLIGTSATGAWVGQDGKIGVYLNGWKFLSAAEGMRLWVSDENILIEYDGVNWTATDGVQTLTDGATIAWDLALGATAEVTLGGNRTLGNPSNFEVGKVYRLRVKQDGTGSRLLTWPGLIKWPDGTAPTLTTTAGRADLFEFVVVGPDMFGRTIGLNYTPT